MVPVVGSVVELISVTLRLARRIKTMAQTAKQSKRRCGLLKDRVGFIEKLLEQLKATRWVPDQATQATLENLHDALDSGQLLVQACQRRRTPWSYLTLFCSGGEGDMDGEFDGVDSQIDRAMQPFHISNLIVLLSLNQENFFMNVLEKLLRDGACKRLPQGDKDEIKKIMNDSDRHHMSPNAKKMLELIINDLKLGEVDTWGASSANLHKAGGISSNESDQLKQVEDIAKDIMELKKAEPAVNKQIGREVQWLAQLAQQVVHLTQHPLAPQMMMRHRDDLLHPMDDLLHDLEEARNLLMPKQPSSSGHGGVGITAAMKATAIYQVGYKIEYSLQVLPIVTMREFEMDRA
uniref:MCAfunc domain-containing protein n=1 Tax=Oryza brachyantha TaxID=4533 RepID=J3NA41_ORYBR